MPETLELLPSPELPDLNGSALILPTPAPAVYSTEAALSESLLRKGTAEPGSGLYPRDGTTTVTAIEQTIAQLTIPKQSLNVAVASGMAAVTGAVMFALSRRGEERARPPMFAHSQYLYPQSNRLFDQLKYMGVLTTKLDVGNTEAVNRLLERQAPEVFFAETVANTTDIPVLDVHNLLEKLRADDKNDTIVVLDNTLPLSSGLNFNDILVPEDRVLITESVTKGGMHNSGHLGVIYSKNEELMDAVRKFKATSGIVTSTGADASILRTLEATTPGFHERNLALYQSTGKLAVALARAAKEKGSEAEFTVSFPTFPEHENYDYATEHLPHGGSPVVFMGCVKFSGESAKQLLQRIAGHRAIQEQIKEGQIFLGQSFGFKEARLLYDPNASQVRVAGGYDIDSDALAAAFFEAAVDV